MLISHFINKEISTSLLTCGAVEISVCPKPDERTEVELVVTCHRSIASEASGDLWFLTSSSKTVLCCMITIFYSFTNFPPAKFTKAFCYSLFNLPNCFCSPVPPPEEVS